MGKFDIGALGEQRVVFGAGAFGGQVDGLGVGDEEHAMRVAHAHGGGIAGKRQVQGVDGMRQRDLGPIELRMAHVDADPAIGQAVGVQGAARRGQAERDRGPVAASCNRTRSGWHCRRPRRGCRQQFQKSSAKSAVSRIANLGKLIKADAAVAVAQSLRQCGGDHGIAPA